MPTRLGAFARHCARRASKYWFDQSGIAHILEHSIAEFRHSIQGAKQAEVPQALEGLLVRAGTEQSPHFNCPVALMAPLVAGAHNPLRLIRGFSGWRRCTEPLSGPVAAAALAEP
jgi:hypothetical protein